MTATDEDRSDLPRDGHLLAALRHAPDRNAEPPAVISAHILAEARAATRRAARSSAANAPRVTRWFDLWLSPVGRAALATVTVGVLVGVLWSVQAPSEAPAARLAGAPKEELRVAPNGAIAPSAPALPHAAAPTAEPTRVLPAPAATGPVIAASPPSRPMARERRADDVRSKTATAVRAPETQVEPPASPRPEPAREDTAPAATTKASRPAQESTATGAAGASQDAAGNVLADVARQPLAAAPALALRAAPAVDDPMDRLSARLDAAPRERVRWQREGRDVATGAAPQRWALALRAAKRGHWQPARAPETPSSALPWLAVAVDGRIEAEWWLEDGALRLREGDVWWRLGIDDAQRRAWEVEASRW